MQTATTPSTPRLPPRPRLSLPFAGSAIGVMRDPVAFQRRGHARYGPVFSARVFEHELTFVDPIGAPALLEQLVRAPDEELSMIDAYKTLVGRIIGPELFIELNRELRHGLSAKYIRRHLGPTASFVPGQLGRHIHDASGELDGLMLANDYVFHVVAHYVLGPEATQRQGAELARLVHLLESDFSVLGMMLPIETPSARRRTQAFTRLVELVELEVQRRLEQRGEHDDFLEYALEHFVDADGPLSASERRLLALRCLGVIFGAHTNTSMSVAMGLFDLLEHPQVLAEVQAEVDALPRDMPLGLDELRNLEHLYRALNETLRRRSVGGIWRQARRPLVLGDYELPVGSLIGASMGLVNLDPGRYAQPERYWPQRYLELRTDSYQSPSVTATPLQFGAFGTGRSLCSGRPLAYAMMALIMVELLRRYEWQIVQAPTRWFTVLTGGLDRPLGQLRFAYRARG